MRNVSFFEAGHVGLHHSLGSLVKRNMAFFEPGFLTVFGSFGDIGKVLVGFFQSHKKSLSFDRVNGPAQSLGQFFIRRVRVMLFEILELLCTEEAPLSLVFHTTHKYLISLTW